MRAPPWRLGASPFTSDLGRDRRLVSRSRPELIACELSGDVASDPKPSRDACGSPRPRRRDASRSASIATTYRTWSEIAPNSQRRFAGGCSACWPEALPVDSRSSTMPPDGADPPQGRWLDPCRARWRNFSPRPPPPQHRPIRSRCLGVQQFLLHRSTRGSASMINIQFRPARSVSTPCDA